ncbi:MAG: acyl carrier protein [Candidatus Omnitrophica bacterium]|jgi:acyl carrier protein|nr:acyl carrier protein [Candidatus Omnitrophota bacterium]
MNLKEEVLNLISKTLDVDKEELIENQALYDSIGVDSTEMVELVVAINKCFGIKVLANEITKNSTPLQIVDAIEKKKQ